MKYNNKLLIIFLLILFSAKSYSEETNPKITLPDLVLQGSGFSVSVEGLAGNTKYLLSLNSDKISITSDENGQATIEELTVDDSVVQASLYSKDGQEITSADTKSIPAILSIAPPLVAIILALVLKSVMPALFAGIWVGAALTYGLSFSGIWKGLLDTISRFTVDAVNDWGHVAIIIFSLMIGGLVGIITKNGGTAGIVKLIVKRISTRKGGQVGTAMLGTAIFFDDYANTLIIGGSMRPVIDKLKISREKLAYIVDSTAAPIAATALISTWIGVETGLIGDAVDKLPGFNQSGYSIFVDSLAYSFYPILAWLFVMFVAFTGLDFGPMKAAEIAAQEEPLSIEDTDKDELVNSNVQPNSLSAIIPILVLLIGTMAGIYLTGIDSAAENASFADVFSSGDSFLAMLWASLASVLVAGVMSLGTKSLSLNETIDAWLSGVRKLTPGIVILIMAWTMAGVNDVLGTSDYLTDFLGSTVSVEFLPAIVFILAAVTAFATGTSWGVMSILMPLVIPLAWSLMESNGLAGSEHGMAIFYASVSSVMAGAVWGDHCSPISDTTVLASIACDCDHVSHVQTQLPYALFVGVVSVVVGLIPIGFGLPSWISFIASIVILLCGLKWFSSFTPKGKLAYQD